ncbi:MAG TPA: hypothetical protein ENJ41_04630, partial [Oceanospirillales bacterium]|nr:hypothetical protein [Oceanospirillales bacterium]
MSIEEIEIHSNNYWVKVIIDFIESIIKLPDGASVVRVFNPQLKTNGYENHHTVIQISCKDMPFLVDSVGLVFSKLALDMELMTHPVAHVERDKAGILKGIKNNGGYSESWMHIEINKIIELPKINDLLLELELVINKVTACVNDWKPMLKQMQAAKSELAYTDDKSTYKKQNEFIDWLLDDNFTFLGYQYYQIKANDKSDQIAAKKSSALGIYTSDAYLQDVDSLISKEYQVKKQSDLMIITKLNARPGIHRAGSLDYIGVLVLNDDKEVVGEHRFVGLFTSAAINTRPWDIPYINEKVNGVINRFKFEKSSHTGKHIIHIMETLPRDELMQSSSDELYHSIYSILTIQERQKSNVTVRQDKFKRFYAFLVHIPRDKFNTKMRETIQGILSREVSGSHIEFQVKIEDTNLTRLYVTVYSKHHIELDIASIELKISVALRSWQDELEDILMEKFGEELGYNYTQKYVNKFPMSYREDVSPRVAAYDVENAAKLVASDGIELSLYRPRDVSKRIFRFKIFRSENTIP